MKYREKIAEIIKKNGTYNGRSLSFDYIAEMLRNTEGESWDSDNIEAQCYIRLAELEDKIESGEIDYVADSKTEQTITDLLIEFDEMGFAPTTVCPDPEKCAIEWREKVWAEFERLEIENKELCKRLDKAVELPLEPIDYHLEPMVARIVERADSNKVDLRMPCYIYFEFDNEEEAEKMLSELSNEHF